MIDAVTRSPSGWLIPDDSTRATSVDARVRMLACGGTWDALRTPEELALPVLGRLRAHRTDRNQLGPVLHDKRSGSVYWLISRGHTAGDVAVWPEGCVVLGASHWLAVPNPANPHSKLIWLHMSKPGVLTGPPWLAAALADQQAATDPHLGTP